MNEIKLILPTNDSIREMVLPIYDEINTLKEMIKNMPKEQKYYRNRDLKKVFGFSDKTIQNYRENNLIPYSFIGEIYYYPCQEIHALLEKNSNKNLL